jgi:prophage regulatory protein
MSSQDKIYFTDREVAARYGVSRPTVWRWLRVGHLPSPETIGPNTKRWKLATLDGWDEQREAQQAREHTTILGE